MRIWGAEAELHLYSRLIKYHDMKTFDSRGTLHILNHNTRWMYIASFKPRPLYPREKVPPRYPVDRRLGEYRAGLFVVAKEKYHFSYRELNPCLQACSQSR
jgi:hypothetical protein